MKPIRSMFPVMILAMFICSFNANAQQVSSFEQLQLLVRPGDIITVTKTDGRAATGKITSLSPTQLRLVTSGVENAFSQSEVVEIQQRRGDSLGNGAKWGALTGLSVFSALAALACSFGGCEGADAPLLIGAGVAYTGLGAAVGVGLDALIIRNQTIFRPTNRAASRFGVAPVLSNHRKGVAVSFSF